MTDKEREVIEWACNLARSVVPGNYGVPTPMCIAVNTLQDKVHALADERGWKSVEEGCSKEFLEEQEQYWQGVEEKLKACCKED